MAAATPKTRRDPRPRSHDGASNGAGLKNADKARHYVGANRATGAVEEYLQRGYQIEECRVDGPRWAAGVTGKVGEPLEYRGHVLMSISKAERQEIEQNGEDGDTGQTLFDELEERMLDKRGVVEDLMRGLSSRYTRAYSEIEGLERLNRVG